MPVAAAPTTQTILFVSNFPRGLSARELAYEFERFGPLVRCDIPAPKPGSHNNKQNAFVEFQEPKDAQEALSTMNGVRFEGCRLIIDWARNPPSRAWMDMNSGPNVIVPHPHSQSGSHSERSDRIPHDYRREDDRERSSRSGRYRESGYERERDGHRERDYERKRRDSRSRSPRRNEASGRYERGSERDRDSGYGPRSYDREKEYRTSSHRDSHHDRERDGGGSSSRRHDDYQKNERGGGHTSHADPEYSSQPSAQEYGARESAPRTPPATPPREVLQA